MNVKRDLKGKTVNKICLANCEGFMKKIQQRIIKWAGIKGMLGKRLYFLNEDRGNFIIK